MVLGMLTITGHPASCEVGLWRVPGLSSVAFMLKASPFVFVLPAMVLDIGQIHLRYWAIVLVAAVEMELRHDLERSRSQKTEKRALMHDSNNKTSSKASFITFRSDKYFYEHRKTCIL